MGNEKKTQTLGMPFGTACGRLRKNILFHLLTRLKENICFKCGLTIEKVEDLSIEHKLPWEGRSADLFWSLDNIAFSHLHCNRPHTNGNQKYTPEEALTVSRKRNAEYMRKNYSPEKRHEKHVNTGW